MTANATTSISISTSAVRSLRFEAPNGVRIRGHYAAPAGDGPHPGVIVIHEIFGLNGDMKEKVARFASMGYAAFAPDLYSGEAASCCALRARCGS